MANLKLKSFDEDKRASNKNLYTDRLSLPDQNTQVGLPIEPLKKNCFAFSFSTYKELCSLVSQDLRFSVGFASTKGTLSNQVDKRALIKELDRQPGRHTIHSPILGIHAGLLKRYTKFAIHNPAFIRFGHALYYGLPHLPEYDISQDDTDRNGRTTLNMIPLSLKEQADYLSKQVYIKYCEDHHLDPKQAVDWSNNQFREGVTYTYDTENEWNTWNVHVVVETRGMTLATHAETYYSPSYLVALHELRHVERIKSFQPDHLLTPTGNSISEMASMIGHIIDQDAIYKGIKNIPLDREVIYSEKLPCNSNENGINLGLIANTFRVLEKSYGTIEAALMSSEGQRFVRKYYDNNGIVGVLRFSKPKKANVNLFLKNKGN